MIEYQINKEDNRIQEKTFFKSIVEITAIHNKLSSYLDKSNRKIQTITALIEAPLLYALSFYIFELSLNHTGLNILFSFITTVIAALVLDSFWDRLKNNKFIGKIHNGYMSLFRKHKRVEKEFQDTDNKLLTLIQESSFQKNLILELDSLITETQPYSNTENLKDDLEYVVYALAYENYDSAKNYIIANGDFWQSKLDNVQSAKEENTKKLNYLKNMQLPILNDPEQNAVKYNLKTML